ncbi:response regulator [Solidesulfovibrio sp.]|uniref:response regulator n=1 Tax=Solidesulfovibrio sp. TaxID=2910990 RepID=UPI00263A3955|nr:response regulator [Solidesulfovibrio sp.]
MRTILVIDDERPTLRMFELYLGAYGYPVLTAASGEEGLAVFDARKPPIVLTDIKMPGMDGLAVLRAVKERRPRTEVVVITGHGDVDLALAALGLRATDFIDKPIRREALEAALARANARLDQAEAGHGEDVVAVERSGDVAVITIHGSLTGETEPYLTQAVRRAGEAAKLLFVFSPDASINGAGLDLLVQAAEDSGGGGRPVALCGLSDNFARVLDRLGVTAKAPRFGGREDALAHLARREDVNPARAAGSA